MNQFSDSFAVSMERIKLTLKSGQGKAEEQRANWTAPITASLTGSGIRTNYRPPSTEPGAMANG